MQEVHGKIPFSFDGEIDLFADVPSVEFDSTESDEDKEFQPEDFDYVAQEEETYHFDKPYSDPLDVDFDDVPSEEGEVKPIDPVDYLTELADKLGISDLVEITPAKVAVKDTADEDSDEDSEDADEEEESTEAEAAHDDEEKSRVVEKLFKGKKIIKASNPVEYQVLDDKHTDEDGKDSIKSFTDKESAIDYARKNHAKQVLEYDYSKGGAKNPEISVIWKRGRIELDDKEGHVFEELDNDDVCPNCGKAPCECEEANESLNKKKLSKQLTEDAELVVATAEAPILAAPVTSVPEAQTPPSDPIADCARNVMSAYQNANKWLDSVKEAVYTRMNCPFFSSFIHTLAHTMPGRFDKFGDILHTENMEIKYPSTDELTNIPENLTDAFNVIFKCLDSIKEALSAFIRATDNAHHGMSCAAEACLNDIESEYPMLYRLRSKCEECKDDSVAFDKYVMQYVTHKDDLVESLEKDKEEMSDLELAEKLEEAKQGTKLDFVTGSAEEFNKSVDEFLANI